MPPVQIISYPIYLILSLSSCPARQRQGGQASGKKGTPTGRASRRQPIMLSSAIMLSLAGAVAFMAVRPAPLRRSFLPRLSVPPPELSGVCVSGTRGAVRSTLVCCEGGDLESKLANMQRENQARGAIFLGFLLLAIAWGFSVPPDIRRSVICSSQAEIDAGLGCVTASAFGQRIADHYQTCGASSVPCVQWDFSIDPGKKAATSFVLDQLRSLDAADVVADVLGK